MKGIVADKPDPFFGAELSIVFLIGNGAMNLCLLHDRQPAVRQPSVQPENKMIFHGEGRGRYERVGTGYDHDLFLYGIYYHIPLDETIGQGMAKCRSHRFISEFEPAVVVRVESKPVPVHYLM
jgi:hypothetical protein